MKKKMIKLTLLCVGLAVVSMVLAGQSSASVTMESVIAMWLFEEEEDNFTPDSSGNGNEGLLMNEPKMVANGKFGGAIEFDGVNDYINCGKNEIMAFADWDFSITFWIKTSTSGTWQTIIAKGLGNWANPDQKSLNINLGTDGGVEFAIDDGTNTFRPHSVSIGDGTWHHIAMTFDRDDRGRIYIDGKNIPVAIIKTVKDITNENPLLIGAREDGYYFVGVLDEVAIFNKVLTQEDVTRVMDMGLDRALGLSPVFPSGKLSTTWATVKASSIE